MMSKHPALPFLYPEVSVYLPPRLALLKIVAFYFAAREDVSHSSDIIEIGKG